MPMRRMLDKSAEKNIIESEQKDPQNQKEQAALFLTDSSQPIHSQNNISQNIFTQNDKKASLSPKNTLSKPLILNSNISHISKEAQKISDQKTEKTSLKLTINEKKELQIPSNKLLSEIFTESINPSVTSNFNKLGNKMGLSNQNNTLRLKYNPTRNIWTAPITSYQSIINILKRSFKIENVPKDTIRILSKSSANENESVQIEQQIKSTSLLNRMTNFLLPHQRKALINSIKLRGNLILADEMGLGKTITSLAVASFYHLNDWPLLVVALSGLLENWRNEIKKFLDLNCNIIRSIGDLNEMNESQGGDQHIILAVSYDFLWRNIEYFRSFTWDGTVKNEESSHQDIPQEHFNKRTHFQVKKKINFIIADEAHYLKSVDSKRSKLIIPFLKSVNRRILATGTPALSRPMELFNLVDVIAGFHYKDFLNRYCLVSQGTLKNNKFMKYGMYKGCSNENELRILLSVLMIRRTKDLIMKELPAKKREHFILEITRPSSSPDATSKSVSPGHSDISINDISFSDDLLLSDEDSVVQNDKKFKVKEFKKNVSNVQNKQNDHILNENNRSSLMQQFREAAELKLESVKLYVKTWLERNHRMSTEYKDDGEKLVIFGHHKVMLDGIEQVLIEFEQNMMKESNSTEIPKSPLPVKISSESENSNESLSDKLQVKKKRQKTIFSDFYLRIDGSTNQIMRHKMVTAFQTDQSMKIALLSITSASIGITLTASSTILFTELWWNPGNILQAEDRVHRIGQKKNVSIIFLLGRNTVDEIIWPKIIQKLKVLEKMDVGTNVLGKVGVRKNISLSGFTRKQP